MTIRIPFADYNHRRFSRPWIAKVTAWPVGGRATLQWGTFLGDHHGGEVEIEAEPGEVIRYGQKDHRAGNRTSAEWAIVGSDGAVNNCTEAHAAKVFRAIPTSAE